jgi:hypothetical protein
MRPGRITIPSITMNTVSIGKKWQLRVLIPAALGGGEMRGCDVNEV